ncbi:MAG: DUF2259 domain-containing protein [Devosia sp.]
MARLVASLIGFLALLVLPALAGDRAQLALIGYSTNGSYFAFEEFGIQDGSGFAYSSIYVIDLAEDSWVVGTPVRAQAESEAVPLAEIRAQTRAKVAKDLITLDIDVPAELVAMIGDGIANEPAQTLSFGEPGFAAGEVMGSHTLELSSFAAPAATPCQQWFTSPPRGYQLRLVDQTDDRVVHRDSALPRSRGCPVDYRLYGVVLPFAADPLSQAVAIISVYTFGFEGPDRRFIVVPLGL